MIALKTARRSTQIAVAAGLPFIAWLNSQNWELLSGNLLSFSFFGYPLADPLAALQVCLGSFSLPWKTVLGGVTVLALAFALGPVFCSWVCPFGLLSELVQGWGGRIGPSGRRGFRLKAVLTVLGVGVFALYGMGPLFNHLSLPGWYTRFFQMWFNQQEIALAGAGLFALALAMDILFRRRLWCRYICPQSVLLNLVHRFSPVGLRVRFSPSRCICSKGDEQCGLVCPLNLNPRMAGRGLEWECSVCGDCTAACADRGRSLTLGFGPVRRR